MMGRIRFLAVLFAALSAPAWGAAFKEGATLEADEGILVTSLKCGSPVLGVQVFQAGKSSGGFWGPLKSEGSINCLDGLKLLRFKAGRYYIGQLYSVSDNHAVPEKDAPQFTIEAGKLNYIGDLYAGEVWPHEVDEQTLLRITGRLLTAINREPQVREALQQQHAGVLARYPFVADPGLSPPLAPAAPPKATPGEAQALMQVGPTRWKRTADGQVRVCPRLIPLPEGAKLAPGETLKCDGEYVAPEAILAAQWGRRATLRHALAQSGDDGPLVITFTLAPEGPKPEKVTERRQLAIAAGQWAMTRHGVGVCYDRRTTESADVASAAGADCPTGYVTTRDYLRIKVGPAARFVSSVTGKEHGNRLLIDYDIDVFKQ
jgi:hypothetical protein